ncbi:immunoglobulin-like domain-containing protein [Peribacillus sp. Bi134]|uniref:immunoglobulin-like domain-containing protein n=1 Tax=Peribacillus sp. Bi134 TaxID=2884272 RepID=UPI001DB2FDA1|nr:immunoglobulin-like domain-containing protein [Peribacillus sp. Bi134]CAH0200258.1 Pesticidal crystal protein Cry22Aa [Peribacillus sp. Bi134]
MKIPLLKVGALTCLTLGLFNGQAFAESGITNACSSFGEIQPNENPSHKQINCLLTNAAIEAEIPPEVVKAVATQENGDWRQFNEDGKPIKSDDGGIGLMQLTNKTGYDQKKLENDIVYNIEAGVKVLSGMYSRSDLPKIKGAGRRVIENWYFPVMAYNGTKPVNSPLYQENGQRNASAYQEEVFAEIEKQSYLDGTKLAKYPFKTTDFQYDRESTENIIFKNLEYTLTDQTHDSVYWFKAGDKVVTTSSANIRKEISTTAGAVRVPPNTSMIITGNFDYHESTGNKFVFYPVQTEDNSIKGYVSSAYISNGPSIVKDTDMPVISGAAGKSIPFNSTFNPKTGIKAKDDKDGDLTSVIRVEGKVDTKKVGTYNLIYTVADKAGNVAKVTRKITVYDQVKPVISGAGNKTIKLNSSFSPKTNVSAKDNADGNLTSKIKVTGTVNTKKKGTYTLKYTVTDSSKNAATVTRKITIDGTKPVISGANSKTVAYYSTFNPKSGVSAKDNLDGNLTSKIKVTGTVNTKKKGTYTLKYTITDSSKNTATVTRKITVDSTKPVISGAKSKTIAYNSTFNPKSGVSAKDNLDGSLTSKIKITGTVNTKKKGNYTLTYTVTDKSKNKAEVKRKITVK